MSIVEGTTKGYQSRCSGLSTTAVRGTVVRDAFACRRRVAEREGFEPSTGCPEPHFQCGAIVH